MGNECTTCESVDNNQNNNNPPNHNIQSDPVDTNVQNRYFSREEIIETSLQQFSSKAREKRAPFHFQSGAVYDGEWVGNMRDGTGTQTWPDGAKYEG